MGMRPAGSDDELDKPISRRLVNRVLIGCLSVAALCAAYWGWWAFVANQFEKNLAVWAEQQRMHGIEFTYVVRGQSGFPGAIQMVLAAPKLKTLNDKGWVWSTDTLLLSLSPWALGQVSFNMKGAHQWQPQKPGMQPSLTGVAQQWAGTVHLDNGLLDTLALSIYGLDVQQSETDDGAQIKEMEIEIWELTADTPEFKIRSRDLELPKSLRAPLGTHVQHFDAKGQLSGGPLNVRAWPAVLEKWRDRGGTLEFTSFDLDYAPLRIRGDGTIALDEDLQPIGAFAVKAEGFFDAVDALTRQGLIPAGVSFATKVTLGVLSKKPENGGQPYLDLALTVQDRTLYAGTIKLLTFAPVRW